MLVLAELGLDTAWLLAANYHHRLLKPILMIWGLWYLKKPIEVIIADKGDDWR